MQLIIHGESEKSTCTLTDLRKLAYQTAKSRSAKVRDIRVSVGQGCPMLLVDITIPGDIETQMTVNVAI